MHMRVQMQKSLTCGKRSRRAFIWPSCCLSNESRASIAASNTVVVVDITAAVTYWRRAVASSRARLFDTVNRIDTEADVT